MVASTKEFDVAALLVVGIRTVYLHKAADRSSPRCIGIAPEKGEQHFFKAHCCKKTVSDRLSRDVDPML